jgi:replicative DNA helicase
MKNLEAEMFVLGNLIRNNDAIGKAELEKEYFSETIHQAIFALISDNYQNDIPSNPITMSGRITADIDVQSYLLRLSGEGLGSPLKPYATIIKKLYQKRVLKEILETQIGQLEKLEATEIIENLNKQAAELQSQTSQYRLTSYDRVLSEIAEEAKNYSKDNFISTGFLRMDKSMGGGMEKGRSYALSAPPKAGKTMLKGTIASNIKKQGKPFLFIAAEMGRREITKRMIGIETGLQVSQMNKNNTDFTTYITQNSSVKSEMYFLDAPRISLEALRVSIVNAVRNKGIEGVVLDYLQLVSGMGKGETIARHQENVAQSIAEICRKENIWCLYSCQINRSGEIRNGDGIIMAADWVYEIVPIEKQYENDKQRMYLKHIVGRSIANNDIGSTDKPAYELINGTHFIEYPRD